MGAGRKTVRQGLVAAALAAVAVTGCSAPPAPAAPPTPSESPVATARDASAAADPAGPVLTFADARLAATADGLAPPAYPVRTNPDGTWLTKDAEDWTAGFLPAALWRVFERTQDPVWRDRAERWQAPLASETTHDDTDLGFKMFMTFAVDHQLTGDESAKQTALAAADTLAARFNPTVGLIRVWDDRDDEEKYQVNIDAMMNLELLYWAGQNGRPQYTDIANRHAQRTMADLVRPDGSTSMFGGYDQRTGALQRTYTMQGFKDDSTWARGQAWAIYGFATAYRYTQDPRYLETAHRTADWFTGHLPPDRVPYWDFDVPQAPPQPRDTSAAAIASSALLELSQVDPVRAARRRRRRARDAPLAVVPGVPVAEHPVPLDPHPRHAEPARGPAGLGDHVRRLLLRRGAEPLGTPGRAVHPTRLTQLGPG